MSCLFVYRMPAFKSSLTKQIEEEKARKQRLEQEVEAMERSVKSLQEKGTAALKSKLSQMGITATTADGVLAVSRSLIAQNKLLIEKEKILQVIKCSSGSSHRTNQLLCLIHVCSKTLLERKLYIRKSAKSMNEISGTNEWIVESAMK